MSPARREGLERMMARGKDAHMKRMRIASLFGLLPLLVAWIYAAATESELFWPAVAALLLSVPAALVVGQWFANYVWNSAEGQLLRERALKAQQGRRDTEA